MHSILSQNLLGASQELKKTSHRKGGNAFCIFWDVHISQLMVLGVSKKRFQELFKLICMLIDIQQNANWSELHGGESG